MNTQCPKCLSLWSAPQAVVVGSGSVCPRCEQPKQHRIVTAAYKMRDGLIITGVRHFSPDMRKVLQRLYGKGYHRLVHPEHHLGGFIDNRSEYHDREVAWNIAERAGQIRPHPSLCPGTLYSEDLH